MRGTQPLRSGSSGSTRTGMRLRLRRARVVAFAVHDDLAAFRRALAAKHFQQLLLPVAGHAGDADDFVRVHLQVATSRPLRPASAVGLSC